MSVFVPEPTDLLSVQRRGQWGLGPEDTASLLHIHEKRSVDFRREVLSVLTIYAVPGIKHTSVVPTVQVYDPCPLVYP